MQGGHRGKIIACPYGAYPDGREFIFGLSKGYPCKKSGARGPSLWHRAGNWKSAITVSRALLAGLGWPLRLADGSHILRKSATNRHNKPMRSIDSRSVPNSTRIRKASPG